jgi:hypothetical protein
VEARGEAYETPAPRAQRILGDDGSPPARMLRR